MNFGRRPARDAGEGESVKKACVRRTHGHLFLRLGLRGGFFLVF